MLNTARSSNYKIYNIDCKVISPFFQLSIIDSYFCCIGPPSEAKKKRIEEEYVAPQFTQPLK